MSEGGYIQGAGDDSEGWSLGLTPELFWKHQDVISRTSEEDLPELISQLLKDSKSAATGAQPVLIKPTRNLYICQERADISDEFHFIIACSGSGEDTTKNVKAANLQCPEGKLGSRKLRKKLPNVRDFMVANPQDIKSQKLLVTCTSGKDLSVGVALTILCMFYDKDGKSSPLLTGMRSNSDAVIGTFVTSHGRPDISKQIIRERLAWISAVKPDANPSRSTLQAVNAFLMGAAMNYLTSGHPIPL
jgi:tRNA A64-2'-O-ribosylphosphate transferase